MRGSRWFRSGGPRLNYPRRQQYRRLSRAGRAALASVAAAFLGLLLVRACFGLPGGLLLGAAVVLGLRARHWLALAGRSRVGARSEDEVRRTLAPLQEHGWRLCRGLRWQGDGDIDSVAIAPTGLGFAIETKTRTYDGRHLGRVGEQASWLGRRRRRWCPRSVLPVLWVVRAGRVDRYEDGVLVVSIDRLVPVLCDVATEIEGGQPEHLVGASVL